MDRALLQSNHPQVCICVLPRLRIPCHGGYGLLAWALQLGKSRFLLSVLLLVSCVPLQGSPSSLWKAAHWHLCMHAFCVCSAASVPLHVHLCAHTRACVLLRVLLSGSASQARRLSGCSGVQVLPWFLKLMSSRFDLISFHAPHLPIFQ